jgi:hypothetical protein
LKSHPAAKKRQFVRETKGVLKNQQNVKTKKVKGKNGEQAQNLLFKKKTKQ